MDDTSQPPAPEDEVLAPVVPVRAGLALVAPNGDSLTESNPQDDDGELDFNIAQVVPRSNPEMGPGSNGRLVPYLSYGWAAVCLPQTSLVSSDGKQMAVIVPLPQSGMMKMSDLKKLANKLWREHRHAGQNDG